MEVKIVTGVPVYTMNEDKPVVESVVIMGDKVEFTGKFSDAKKIYPYAEIITLEKGALIPGFVDPHIHILPFSMMFRDLDLSDVEGEDEVIDMVKDWAEGKKETDWIIGGGVPNDIFETMDRFILDSITPYNPVLLYSENFNSALANTRALEIAGIDESSKDPMGGRFERNGEGKITGHLRDRAVEMVSMNTGMPDSRKTVRALKHGIYQLLKRGVTAICDCSVDPNITVNRFLFDMWRNRSLKIRTTVMFGDEEVEFIKRSGVISGFGDDYLRIGGVKIILDGKLQAQTAYLKQNYLNTNGNGVLYYSEDELFSVLKRSYASHVWSAIHTVGDGAVEVAINAFERVVRDRTLPRLIRRIEHVHIISGEDIKKLSDLGIIAVVNPSYIPVYRDLALKFLGKNAGSMLRYGTMKKEGVQLAFSSDAPMNFPDPLLSIYCAVERRGLNDGPELRFFPREKVDIKDAVFAHTFGASVACGMDDIVGKIEAGKKADFVHISEDIVKEGEDKLADVRVLRTFLNGEIVFVNKKV